MIAGFYLSYAWRSLRRGGQRSLLAVACVSFGVLSLVALQQLASVIRDSFLVSPKVRQGGDLILSRSAGTITETDLERLESLGIEQYAPLARTAARLMKTTNSGRVSPLGSALGIAPERFPLYGQLRLSDPPDASIAERLAPTGSAIITEDLAEREQLAIGDEFALIGDPKSPPVRLEVSGIASVTPSRESRSIFIGLDTVVRVGLGDVTHVAVRHEDPESIVSQLEAAGWQVREIPKDARTDEAELFRFMLAGTGILGLLIGGIGAANTMQVLLARRAGEIATLKTLGYRQPHLLVLFGLEAALLGVGGSVLGIGLGLFLARLFSELLGGLVPYLLVFRVSPSVVLGGLLVGVLTNLIFGLVAIVRASHVRPSTLLRGIEVSVQGRRKAATVGLYSLLFGLFGGLSSIILGSALKGFGVVAGGLFLLSLLGLVLGAILIGVVRIPLPGTPLLSMARRNLRHQPIRSVFGLVALFVGIYAIGFASITLLNATARLSSRQVDRSGMNLRVYGVSTDERALDSALQELGIADSYTEFSAEARVFSAADSLLSGLRTISGRYASDFETLLLVDSLDVPFERSAYLIDWHAKRFGLAAGDTLRLRNQYAEREVVLAGIFDSQIGVFALSGPPTGLIVGKPVAEALSGEVLPIQVSVAADPDRIREISDTLGSVVPNGVVIGKNTVYDIVNAAFRGLFWFTVSIATLALIAGAVLIANAVGLSMVERKRELGVLKAIGYGSRQVLWIVVLENGLLGLISGVLGVAALLVTVLALGIWVPAAELSLEPGPAIGLVFVSIAFATLSALLVAWQPTHVRPLEVLRGE